MRLSPSDVANSVRMTRSVYKDRTALLVEGLKDVRFYRNLINDASCSITPTDGKPTALGALKLLGSSATPGVLVILDLDLSSVNGRPFSDLDIVVTDTHDLEGILLQSTAIDRILIECDLEPGYFGSNIHDLLLFSALPVGYLRWISQRNRLSLSFNQLDFARFVNLDFTTDLSKLIDSVIQSNPRSMATHADLTAMVQGLTDPTHDRWAICCGHDLAAILALGISRATSRAVTGAMVERNLRLAYDVRSFAGTRLYVAIRDWEGRNPPFAVLK